MKKLSTLILTALIVLSVCACGSSGGESGSTSGAGTGTMTLLIYMIGSDLESMNGCASMDIREMVEADPGKHVRVILETGGSNKWLNYGISGEKLQRWEVTGNGLTLVEENENARMSDADTLSDFLKWGNERYPAERMGVILWNHGGGSALGYGQDELYPEGMLSLPGIREAFQKAGCHYDFIGFDACLMSTVETGCVLSEYADYMIASEEIEPGDGWFYTEWLKKLEKTPALPTEELGKVITESYISQSDRNPYDSYTLAMLRLDRMPEFMKKLTAYFEKSETEIREGGYTAFAQARVSSTSFGFGQYEQIDVGDYLAKADPEGTSGLAEALRECVVCFETNLENTSGLAMYYPYRNLSLYTKMMRDMSEIGYPGHYFDFFNSFCSVLSIADSENPADAQSAPGKAVSEYGITEQVSGSTSAGQYAAQPWYRDDVVKQYYPEASLSSHAAELVRDGEDVFDSFYWIELPEGVEWDHIWYREDRFLLDDGEKLLSIGTQAQQDLYQEEADLIVYNPIWFCIGTTVVPAFFQYFEERDDGLMNAVHYIPAVLNGGDTVQIVLKEDRAARTLNVLGYFIEDLLAEYDGIKVPPKAYSQFKAGDELQFPVDCYDYEYRYLGTELMDDKVTVGEEGPEVIWGYMGNRPARFSCALRDIYNNYISTPWAEHRPKDTPELTDIRDEDSWVSEAAPGNDPEAVGLPYGIGLSYGFRINNDSHDEIHAICLKRADYPEELSQDILYEPVPDGKSAIYADIEHYSNWDCTAWSMKIYGTDGKTSRKEIVFNPWAAKEIRISWDAENDDYAAEVTYSREGGYLKDIAAFRNSDLSWWSNWEETETELSDAMSFLLKFPPWRFSIDNRGSGLITHMYMEAADQELSEKMKEVCESFVLDDFGGNDLIMDLVPSGSSVDYLYPVCFDASLPVWAFTVTDQDADIREALPMVPFSVWKVFFEDLSGKRSPEMEFRPWETSRIVIKEKTGQDTAYECEFQP